MLLDLLKEWIW